MSSTPSEDEARELCKVHGTEIRVARHGTLWKIGDSIVNLPRANASQNPRTWKNTLANVRRALKAAGLEVEETPEGIAAEKEAEAALDGVVSLPSLGIYVAPSIQTTVITDEVVLPLEALHTLLEAHLPAHGKQPGEVDRVVDFVLSDAKGTVLTGPFTLKVSTTIEREISP